MRWPLHRFCDSATAVLCVMAQTKTAQLLCVCEWGVGWDHKTFRTVTLVTVTLEASEHPNSAPALVGRLGFGDSCPQRWLRRTGLLSTFSGSQIPYSLCSFASSWWLGELLSCSTQLSPWQIRLGLSVPEAFLACSSHSKSGRRKKRAGIGKLQWHDRQILRPSVRLSSPK